MSNVLEKVRTLWNKDQIKAEVMLSLTLQIILIFLAPQRQRSCKRRLLLLLWLAYLGADYVATLALGSILTNTFDKTSVNLHGQSLTAFWAPFLLLHLGGPDNITSYSVEDNELWLRHFFSFVLQVSLAFVVLVQSTLQTARLLVPKILIFIVGVLKFSERTLALRAASMQQIKHSILSDDKIFNCERLEDSVCHTLLQMEQHADEEIWDTSDVKFILEGYITFLFFKPHVVGTIVNYGLDIRQSGVLKVHKDFKLIRTELSFFFDILHTKATIIHCTAGHVIRITTFVSTVVALLFFHISEKQDYESSDLVITYILLSVALFLEIYSALHLVTSKWMTISLLRLNRKWYTQIARCISRAKYRKFCCSNRGQLLGHMGQYSLIQSAMKEKELNWFKKAWYFSFKGEESTKMSDILEKTVINHIDNICEPWAFYGDDFSDWLRKIRSSWITNTLDRYNLTEIKVLLKNKAFDECVIAWHMVTEICYFATNNAPSESAEGQMREAMYKLSNYMMYLVLKRSSMMPPGIAEIRNLKTLTACSKIVENTSRDNKQTCIFLYNEVMIVELGEILSWGQYLNPDLPSLSALPLARLIIRHLREIAEMSEDQWWGVIRDAWLEMLTYAALRCSPTEHVRGLSRGGELLTHFWLLLAHYGIMDEYNASEVLSMYATFGFST